jgi:hypothetical protein
LWFFALLFSVAGCGEARPRLHLKKAVPEKTAEVMLDEQKASLMVMCNG